jgi:two-component system, NarL family, nitrate/nitrite response regulator NarL
LSIRIYLISDCRITLWGLERLIETAPQQFTSVGQSFDCGASAVNDTMAARPDVILLDIDSDTANVPSFISSLHAASPAKILLLTRLEDTDLQDLAILGGARGIIERDAPPEQLLNALAKVHEGQLWLDRNATGRIFVKLSRIGGKPAANTVSNQIASLTEREQKIVAFIARNSGAPGKSIAAKLHISESTLRNHLTTIYEKLGVANRNGLLAYAYQNGIGSDAAQ